MTFFALLALGCREPPVDAVETDAPADTDAPDTDLPVDTDVIDTDLPLDTDAIDTDAPDTDVVVLTIHEIPVGVLVISEMQRSPTKVDPSFGQWLEIHSTADVSIDLFGLVVASGAAFTIGEHVLVQPRGFVVVGNNLASSLNGGVVLDYANVGFVGEWGEVELRAGGVLMDRVGLDRDYTPGAATQLDPARMDAISNDKAASWCDAIAAYGDGDLGTPGAANAPCPVDGDFDGFLPPEDCDDTDFRVFPGAVEIYYDGVDQDCDGSSDYDQDGDGADHDGYGGDDCDDADPGLRPDAVDLPGDGIDQDCDGSDATGDPILGLADLSPGDLVISEVMRTPLLADAADGQWIELHNTTSDVVYVDGLVVECVGVDRFTIRTSSLLDPGEVFVLGGSDDPLLNGGVAVDFAYSPFAFPDEPLLLLQDGTGTVYDGLAISVAFPYTRGAALALDPPATDGAANDDPANWCDATSPFGDGDLGTPGAANDPC